MHNKNNLKLLSIFWLIALSIVSVEAIVQHTEAQRVKLQNNNFLLTPQLPIPRAFIPYSIQGRIASTQKSFNKQTKSNFECNTTVALCTSFEGNETLKNVSAWMGFDFKNSTGKYFIATYGQKAKDLGNRCYSTKEWDKKHLWLNIGINRVPLALQTRFVGIDKESSNEWYTVDYIGYRMANTNIDYSKYSDNISTSTLVLLINPKSKEVIKYHIEYYDENDKYIDNYQIEVGDEIESYFLGFNRKEEDVIYLFSIEEITTVTSPITFSYKEQYPGKDFNCTNCGNLDLAKVEFKYMFEAYGKTRSSFTKPLSLMRKANPSNNSDTSRKKSVPLSGFWILLLLILSVVTLKIKRFK